ncbi:M6 family metalloprotease domain-containing protein [Planctomyces sp. SH-PL62]|uniref:M6 family metalloprotease domain-containing protein n=1 Tax=Planctomyces sp. SH-PL62 TaxID=1636152 RepID=UPI00078D69B3|nr:M6 family metalloprotease domain-containing protein [Planctomyces sp. SH-PL62]AMV40443.1 Leupeptin-inactivating enzyme 1 precursor [Planctomyces sp. SH-PL62]
MSAIFGEMLTFPQANGPEVQLRVFGDEHYARYEDVEGYTVVYDEALGRFCYADLAGNRLVSTGVTIDGPPPPGVVRHLQESLTVRQARIEEREMLHHPPEAAAMESVVRTFGPNQGLLNGRQLSIGTVRGLTILVNFQDVSSTTTASDVEEMLNGDDYTENGNISSVRQYFLRVSNGMLDYTNTVVGPFTLSRNRRDYVNTLLVEEALRLAVASGLDLRQFDSRGEGIIDAINILYAGQSLYENMLWPHNSLIDLQFGPIRTNLYLLTGLGRNPSELTIGTFCHENGHLLCRFPDMYDYGSRDGDSQNSSGIGYYCLMGAGNHLDDGRSPAPVCAYLRDLAGWVDTVVDLNAPGAQVAEAGRYDVVFKYRTSKRNEYFLVENRTRVGLDRACPSSGLAIYHCDILGSNERQEGTADRHYQCALLQADGRRDLEANPRVGGNQGDGGDLFGPMGGVVVSSMSNPHSREWDGRESGLILSDIEFDDDDRIRFRVGGRAASQSVRGEQATEVRIPDNNTGGVSSIISITASGIVRRIKVDLEIRHPFIGDLVVELLAPSGTRSILHSRRGGAQDDLIASFDSERPGELASLVGQPLRGNWVLRVSDRARRDVGRLVKWSLEAETASA